MNFAAVEICHPPSFFFHSALHQAPQHLCAAFATFGAAQFLPELAAQRVLLHGRPKLRRDRIAVGSLLR